MTDLLPEVAPPAWEEAGDTEEPAPEDNKFDTKSSRSFLDDGVFDWEEIEGGARRFKRREWVRLSSF